CMSNGNGASKPSSARKIVEFLLRERSLIDRRIPPIVRHSLHVAFGANATSQPVDRTLVLMFRYGREVEGIKEMEFLLLLIELCGRVVPLAYPDEDWPDFIITHDGLILWEAAKPPTEATRNEETADTGARADFTP
ncbi:MAG: hypothetical protein NUW08_03360, partial [Candidatus Uhrbacteria bacterium]|nr:hypothetical protein [Candidatus Uhrbacteria bacterium]